MLPNLQKLDNAAVSQEEKTAAKKLDLSSIDNEESEIADQDDDIDENKKTIGKSQHLVFMMPSLCRFRASFGSNN